MSTVLRLVNGTAEEFLELCHDTISSVEEKEEFAIRRGSHRRCISCGGVKKYRQFKGTKRCLECRNPWRIKHPKITNKQGYDRYLRSAHWKTVRGRYWGSDRPKSCYICDGKARELHHRTYERLGRELLTDLVAICRECHEAVHTYHNLHRNLSLWDATRACKASVNKERQAEDSRG